jgi:hypothetical protein
MQNAQCTMGSTKKKKETIKVQTKMNSRKCKMHNAQWGALRRKKKRSKFKQK